MKTPVHPYFTRLSIDLDPAGNPIARHITEFREGQEKGCVWLAFPDPFDDLSDAWADLVTDFANVVGEQLPLF